MTDKSKRKKWKWINDRRDADVVLAVQAQRLFEMLEKDEIKLDPNAWQTIATLTYLRETLIDFYKVAPHLKKEVPQLNV